MDKYSWSFRKDEEIYTESANTIEECIEEAKMQDEEYDVVYIGENQEINVDDAISSHAENIIDTISDNLHDMVGEVSDDWVSGVTEGDVEILDYRIINCIKAWMKDTKNLPKYYKVINVQEYEL